MKSIFLRSYSNQLHSFSLSHEEAFENPLQLLQQEILQVWGIPIEDQALFHNGKLVHNVQSIERLNSGTTIDINLKLQGGKGGFGSLLRGQAISKRKITNFDASRDLQGRRIRNVKYHQKIMEWAKKKKEEEKQIKKELDDYTKSQKDIQTGQRTFKLTQEFKDKVDKWDTEMGSSIRAGVKKSKNVGDKRDQDDVMLDDFEEPKRKKKVVTEKLKERPQKDKDSNEEDLDSKISQKLAVLLEDKDSNGEIVSKKVTEESLEITGDLLPSDKEIKPNGTQNKEEKVFEPIVLKAIGSLDDLVKLGPDHLKHELMRLGLKCGGNTQEKAKRLYDIKLNPELLLSPKYLAKK